MISVRRFASRTAALAAVLAAAWGVPAQAGGYLDSLPPNDPWLATVNQVAEQGCRIEPGELMMSAVERGITPPETMDRLAETAAAGHLDSQGGDADGENLYILKNWKGC